MPDTNCAMYRAVQNFAVKGRLARQIIYMYVELSRAGAAAHKRGCDCPACSELEQAVRRWVELDKAATTADDRAVEEAMYDVP